MKSTVSTKEIIKSRSRTAVYVCIALALLIVGRIFQLQVFKKAEIEKTVANIQKKKRVIPATRGNIYASDGLSLLATSVPKYLTIIDAVQPKNELFAKSIDSLAFCLSRFFEDKSEKAYKEMIVKARKQKNRYLTLGNRKIDHTEKQLISTFPLFRERPYKGGGRFDKEEQRFLPLKNLAMRTIGKMKKDDLMKGDFGLEASFDNYLRGKDGVGFYERLAGGFLKPVDLDSDINAETGRDIVTTLDINFQDIAESALEKQVVEMDAKYGSVVVMEIATGHVKAITNLTRSTDKEGAIKYVEDHNYAVKEGTDPGSTFKLASMAAMMEHSGLDLDADAVDCGGQVMHGGLTFTCAHTHGKLTVRQVFEKSCNVGIYALMKSSFGFDNPAAYYDYLTKFNLTKATGFQLKGEPNPLIKTAESKSYSTTTMPWTSIGYESRITPIQMLTFYNAVANNGKWVQPIIVKQIKKGAKTENYIVANIIEKPFASKETIAKLKSMMEGVVQNGTARNINYGSCTIAGKTGTAQKREGGKYTAGKYYTSFVGYFPAQNPRYSCIVVINEPKGDRMGGDVSAPVFKNIAEKIFSYDISLHPKFFVKANTKKLQNWIMPGQLNDQKLIASKLKLGIDPEGTGFVTAKLDSQKNLVWKSKNPQKNIEEIIGLSLKDALPFLENKGYKVSFTGIGKVKEMSVENDMVKLSLQ